MVEKSSEEVVELREKYFGPERSSRRPGVQPTSRTSAQQGELATSRTSARADSRADVLEVPLRADAEVKTTLPPSLRRQTIGVVKVSANVSRARTA